MLSGANAGAGGVLLPGISIYYNVDKSTLGYIFLATTIGYLIAAFVSGPLTEKLGQRWFLLLGAAAFLSGAFLIALKPPYCAYSPDAVFLATSASFPQAVIGITKSFIRVKLKEPKLRSAITGAFEVGWNIPELIDNPQKLPHNVPYVFNNVCTQVSQNTYIYRTGSVM